mmetsp:Transcript_23968/g.32975  ORF Transcript_23968/g.32975 Transcript_23968/m.32975 type:complete len:514 (+) Transcript_23968:43-1584(+)|eukprot:CAMPEP_0196581522 /NCGR_PEP_ID=MMETSP1081-20130531/34013_1 /TAXON_ID=36882 /ORGANISM="Pyramimonas amylifera, Strain CCMP720" /LENGTH=513 /DNA_ID=CAMNT_0041901781 /DNA_START=41 /DNA_END=1582 /DNA_ORIENTATION=+
MAWEYPHILRMEVVQRAIDNINAVGFFTKRQLGDVESKVKSLEMRSYAKAEMAGKVTTGDRPHVEGIRMYTHDFGIALRDFLVEGGCESTKSGPASKSIFDITNPKEREVLTKERAGEVLAPVLAPGASFSEVTLSTKSFGADSSEVAAAALENISATLHHANLSDIIAGRPEAEALIALKKVCSGLANAKLKHLDLSDNALGEKGVRAVGDILKSQNGLESLAFMNDGISAEAAAAIAELLPNPLNLKKLHFFNNMSGDPGAGHIASVLARAPHMEDFRMGSTRVMQAGGLHLAKAIHQGTKLVKLDLKDNSLGPVGGKAFALVLQKHPNLRHLNFSETALCNSGAAALVEGLAVGCPNLEVLELGCNEITSSGVARIAVALAKMPALKTLIISENEIGEKGAIMLANAFTGSTTLETLDVRECQIGRLGAISLAKCTSSKSSFRLLEMDSNMIPEDALDEIKQIFEGAKCGLKGLGSLEENDEEGENEEEEEDQVEEDDDDLNELMASFKV